MKFIKSFLIILLSLCLFIALWAFAVLYTFQQTIQNPDYYISLIKNLDISQIIYDTVEVEISEKIGQEFPSEIPNSAKKLVKEKIKQIFEENIEDSTYAFYDYITGKTDDLNISIDTRNVKKELKPLALEIILDSQSKAIREKFSDRIKNEFNLLWEKMMIQVPDTITGEMILKELDKSSFMDNLDTWAKLQSLITMIYYLTIASIIIIIILIILLHFDLKKSLLLFGTLFLLAGGILLLPLLFINAHLILNILANSSLLELTSQEIPNFVIIILKDMIGSLIYNLRNIFIGYVLIGICSVIGSFFLQEKIKTNN